MDKINSEQNSNLSSADKSQKVKVSKFEKLLISFTLVLVLILVVTLCYVLLSSKFTHRPKSPVLKSPSALKIDQNKVIKNPTERDLQNLVQKIKNENEALLQKTNENISD